MLNFQCKVSESIDQVHPFIKMYGVKGKLSKTIIRGMGIIIMIFFALKAIFCRYLQ